MYSSPLFNAPPPFSLDQSPKHKYLSSIWLCKLQAKIIGHAVVHKENVLNVTSRDRRGGQASNLTSIKGIIASDYECPPRRAPHLADIIAPKVINFRPSHRSSVICRYQMPRPKSVAITGSSNSDMCPICLKNIELIHTMYVERKQFHT